MKFVKLKDLLVETKDGEWGKDEPVNEDDIKVAVIRGADFKNIRVNDFSAVPMKYVPKRKVERKALKEGDILIETAGGTATRPTGRTAIVKRRHLQNGPVLCASFARYMRPNVEMILPDYLYWYLQYLYTIGEMARNQVQHTGVARFQFTQFSNNTYIPVPEFPYQRKVVSILNALDEKIELNNRINKTLEEMAQAIFKSWFVDFEPFRDGEFVESELGMIPKGWEVISLGDFVEIRTRSIDPQKYPDQTFEHYSIPAFDNAKLPVFEKGSEIKSNKYMIDKNSILVSKLNPSQKRVWYPVCLTDGAICSTEFINYRAKEAKFTDFLYSLVNSYRFSEFMIEHATGSTNSRQRVAPKQTLEFKFPIPCESILLSFSKLVKPIYQQINKNLLESKTLKILRDTLLPKLMSGEIRVPLD